MAGKVVNVNPAFVLATAGKVFNEPANVERWGAPLQVQTAILNIVCAYSILLSFCPTLPAIVPSVRDKGGTHLLIITIK